MSSSSTLPALSPRSGAAILTSAIRYAVGRLTGIYLDILPLGHALADSLTPEERRLVAAAAAEAHTVVSKSQLGDPEESEAWRTFLSSLRQLDGPGSSAPVTLKLPARTLALCTSAALRRLLDGGGTSEQSAALAAAVREAAPLISPADRVLLMRDLYERHAGRFGVPLPLDADWRGTYDALAAMELDAEYLAFCCLPLTLS